MSNAQNPFTSQGVSSIADPNGGWGSNTPSVSDPLGSIFKGINPGQTPTINTGQWLAGQQAAANDRAAAATQLGSTGAQMQTWLTGPNQAGASNAPQNTALGLSGAAAQGLSPDQTLQYGLATGQGPNLGGMVANAGAQQALAQSQAQAASTRGNFGLAGAQKAAQSQAATGALNAANQGAQINAANQIAATGQYSNAMQGARSNFGQQAAAARGQDIAFGQNQNQYGLGAAGTELGLYGQQAGYQTALGGQDQTAAAQAAQLAQQQAQLQQQQNQTATQAQTSTQQTGGNMFSGLLGAIGGGIGGMFSDENIKGDIAPADDSGGGKKFGKALSGALTGFSQGYSGGKAPSFAGSQGQAPQAQQPSAQPAQGAPNPYAWSGGDNPNGWASQQQQKQLTEGTRLHDDTQHASTHDDTAFWAAVGSGQPMAPRPGPAPIPQAAGTQAAMQAPQTISDERAKHRVGFLHGHAPAGAVSDERAKKEVSSAAYEKGLRDALAVRPGQGSRPFPLPGTDQTISRGQVDAIRRIMTQQAPERSNDYPVLPPPPPPPMDLAPPNAGDQIARSASRGNVPPAPRGGDTNSPVMQQLDHFQPAQFRYKDPRLAPNPEAGDQQHVGVIAQDVERGPAGATLVRHDPRTGLRSLDTNAMVGTLAAGAGALKKRTDDHAARIQALESALYGQGGR